MFVSILYYVTTYKFSSWPIVKELVKVAVRPWSKLRASHEVIKNLRYTAGALFVCGFCLDNTLWLCAPLCSLEEMVVCTSVLTRRNGCVHLCAH
jgi:hypothetical protein